MINKRVWYMTVSLVGGVLAGCANEPDEVASIETGVAEEVVADAAEVEVEQEVLGSDRPPLPVEELSQEQIDALNAELDAYAERHDGEWLEDIRSLISRALRNEIRPGTRMLANLSSLSPQALRRIGSVSVRGFDIPVVPELPDELVLQQLSFARTVQDVSELGDVNVACLQLVGANIDSIAPLATNEHVSRLNVAFTQVSALPDMTGMLSLTELHLGGTPIRTLDNIETIPGEFDLFIIRTSELESIDALLESNIRVLYIDSFNNTQHGPRTGTYERFESWFDENLEKLQARNPNFQLEFNLPS